MKSFFVLNEKLDKKSIKIYCGIIVKIRKRTIIVLIVKVFLTFKSLESSFKIQ